MRQRRQAPSGCGNPGGSLREARPIGRGPRFHPQARGPVIGSCRPTLGPRRGVHIELFAANRVVVLAAGIGVRGPVARAAGRISAARCYGAVVTIEPTGVVLVRRGARLTLADVFRAWGEPLSSHRAASFAAAAATASASSWTAVAVADRLEPSPSPTTARSWSRSDPGAPHARYTFPPGSSAGPYPSGVSVADGHSPPNWRPVVVTATSTRLRPPALAA